MTAGRARPAAPEERRAAYVGLMSTAPAPLCLAGIAGGVPGDALGYPAVFGAGAVLSAAVLALLARGRHPRRGRADGAAALPL